MAQVTFRDIDNKRARFPTAVNFAVNPQDFGTLTVTSDPRASVPGHKRWVEYTPVANPSLLRIHPDASIRSGDIYVIS